MDLSKAITLFDSHELIDPECNFKLCAGPGAGKTTFLINHIKNVLANSKRLAKTKKIACITYTNIGVETIVKRLDVGASEVEVSTIHAFLYKHVVKPYLWVINDEYNIPLADVIGHDEIIPRYSIVQTWKERTNQWYVNDNDALRKDLMTLQWHVQSDGEIILKFKYPSKLKIRNDSLIEYKRICWENALISHDDILFFSHEILNKKERILDILRAKFPYFFVDEFQDTHPIQSAILKKIGQMETVVGVIGDPAQSIYNFLGADVNKFLDFEVRDMKLYKIESNHRSTNEIIRLLNYARNDPDFKQENPEFKIGMSPKIIVGGFLDSYNEAINISGDTELVTLAFKNDIVNIMKFGRSDAPIEVPNINEPLLKDDNRGWMITHLVSAIEYCKENKIKDAINYMKKGYRRVDGFEEKHALQNLIRLLASYHLYSEKTIMEFYNEHIYGFYGVKDRITKGRMKKYYEALDYSKFAIGVKITDNDSLYRTIHNAKVDEFASVLLIIPQSNLEFDEEKELEFLFNPDIHTEKNRRYYVALSRAMNNLFISIPQLSKENEAVVKKIGFEVVRC